MKVEITLIDDGRRVRVRSPYSPILVERFKMVPGYRYDGSTKTWTFPSARDCLLMVTDVCGLLPQMLPAEVRDLLGPAQPFVTPPVSTSAIDGYHFLTQPYRHQKVNLARLVTYDRWLIADEQGAGKSHTICNRLRWQHHGDTLILCPKSVMNTWRQELWNHAGLQCILIEGERDKREELIESATHNIKVANYEQLLHTPLIRQIKWTTLVCDELHRLKNFTAQTSRVAQAISVEATYVYGLSGTPAPNGLEDWLGILAIIDPSLLDKCRGARGDITKTAFEARYCLKGRLGENGPFTVVGYRNVPELHAIVQSVTSRNTKKDCLDLPEKIFSTRSVALEGEQRRVYNVLKKDAVVRLKDLKKEGQLTVRNVLTESLRLLQVVGGFVPDDDGQVYQLESNAKVAALDDLLDELGPKQVVVWACFKAEVAFLAEHLGKRGTVVTLTGDTPALLRTEAIERFSKREADFFIATAAAGGTGINGLTVADTEVYFSRNWTLTDYLQSQDRLHRVGQKNTVSVVKLIATGTVDDKIDQCLDQKQEMQEMLLMSPEEMF